MDGCNNRERVGEGSLAEVLVHLQIEAAQIATKDAVVTSVCSWATWHWQLIAVSLEEL